jgi:MFS family permease
MCSQAPVSFSAYRNLLKQNRNFRLLWSAQLVSEIGDWLYTVAIYSLLLELTGSARAVALAFVLQVLPQFFAAPAAGVLSDRLSRLRIMVGADLARAVIVALMIFAQTRQLLPLLYTLLLLETIFWAAFEPARTAVIPNITQAGGETLVANALSSSTWAFTLAMGSSLGGLLAAMLGRNAVFLINSATFLLSAALLLRMRFQEPHLTHSPGLRLRDMADFTPILEGIRYVSGNARLLATLLVKAGLGLMGTNWVLLPLLGEREFPVLLGATDPRSAGALGMSLLIGSRGLGALIGPFLASLWARASEKRFRLGILFGYLAAAAGYMALSAAPSLPLACLCVMLAHSGGSVTWVYSTTLLQNLADDRFRGRVFSAEWAFNTLVLSFMSYSAGVAADSGVSIRTLAFATGAVMLGPALAWWSAQRLWSQACLRQ